MMRNYSILAVEGFDSLVRVSVEGLSRAITGKFKVLIVCLAYICVCARARVCAIKKLSKLSKLSPNKLKTYISCGFSAVDSLVRVGGGLFVAKLKDKLPEVARIVADLRRAFGNVFMDDLIKRAKQGEPTFYAEENGISFGVRCREIGKAVSLKDVVISNPYQSEKKLDGHHDKRK